MVFIIHLILATGTAFKNILILTDETVRAKAVNDLLSLV